MGKLKRTVPSDYLAVEPFESLVNNILHHPSLTLLFAASGEMKSYFALSFAKAIAEGSSFMNEEIQHPRKVVYLDSELSPPATKNRLEQLKISSDENLCFLTPCTDGINLSEKSDRKELSKLLTKEKAQVLIIDNIRTSTQIVENSADEITPLNSYIKGLRDQGISVLVIHHANKDGQSYAGSSNIVTVFDTVFGLERNTDRVKRIVVHKDREGMLANYNYGYIYLSDNGLTEYKDSDGINYTEVAIALESKIMSKEITIVQECVDFLRQNNWPIANHKKSEKVSEFLANYGLQDNLSTHAGLKQQLQNNRKANDAFTE